MRMRVSVITPVLDEEEALPPFLAACSQWRGVDEVLFVDGGSTDSTCELLRGRTVITGERGRGSQCRAGAQRARGDALVFVHADSIVPAASMRAICDALARGAAWGCLTLRFDSDAASMKVGAWASNARVRLTGIPFGDQTMFMTRSAYDEAGGMPPIPLMEDYELARRLRAIAWPEQLPQKVYTSARRFQECGAVRTMFHMRRLRHLHRKGVDAETIAAMYRELTAPSRAEREPAGAGSRSR